jgi:hypothetical protein
MNAVEIYNAKDSDFIRFEHQNECVADDIDKACQTLNNLVERLRCQV